MLGFLGNAGSLPTFTLFILCLVIFHSLLEDGQSILIFGQSTAFKFCSKAEGFVLENLSVSAGLNHLPRSIHNTGIFINTEKFCNIDGNPCIICRSPNHHMYLLMTLSCCKGRQHLQLLQNVHLYNNINVSTLILAPASRGKCLQLKYKVWDSSKQFIHTYCTTNHPHTWIKPKDFSIYLEFQICSITA